MRLRIKTVCYMLLPCAAWMCSAAGRVAWANDAPQDTAKPKHTKRSSTATGSKSNGLPAGKPMVWEDRGDLTPSRVYWGAASLTSDPMSRLPAPPFAHFEKDMSGTSPKFKLKDSKGVKWTAKLGEEARADAIAPRLAWALGFGAVEGYYIASGRVEGIDAKTDLGLAKGSIKPDGSFQGGARFKRHNPDDEPIKDAKGQDLHWDEANNPGVPPEQLSGLLIFDVLVNNWDAQKTNCKVYHAKGPNGPQNWYIVSDMGASFADGPKHKFILADYVKEPSFVKGVSGDFVMLNFSDAIHSEARLHQKIPLAHAQWFRVQLAKLTNEEIQAAFDAGYATDALNRAYASGDAAQITAAREHELSAEARAEIAAFVAKLRAKIDEFMHKVPPQDSHANN